MRIVTAHSTLLLLFLLCFGCGQKSDERNRICITTLYEGASAETVEHAIAEPLEHAFRDLQTSSVSTPGICVVIISSEASLDSLRYLVKARMPDRSLPKDIDPPVVIDYLHPRTCIRYVLKSKIMPLTQLRKWNEEVLAAALERMPKVRAVYTVGGGEQVIRISPDLRKLEAYSITLQELADPIEKEVFLASGTELFGVKGSAYMPEDLENLVIRSEKNKTVLLKDVAEVSLTVKDDGQEVISGESALYSGTSAAIEGVVAFSNDISEAEREKQFYEVLNSVQKKLPAGITVTTFLGTSTNNLSNCLVLNVQFPAGAEKEFVSKTGHQVGQLLLDNAGVVSFVSETGFSLNGTATEEDLHTFYISTDKKNEVENALQEKLKAIPGISFWFVHTGDDYPADHCVKISSSEKEQLVAIAAACREKLENASGISNIHWKGNATAPVLNYVIDHENVNSYGINTSALQTVIDLYRNGRAWHRMNELPIELKIPETNEPLLMQAMKIKTMNGTIPLTKLVSLRMNAEPARVLHENGQPLVVICFTVKNKEALKTAENLLQGIKTEQGVTLRLEKDQ